VKFLLTNKKYNILKYILNKNEIIGIFKSKKLKKSLKKLKKA
jgi:hypothetical protein